MDIQSNWVKLGSGRTKKTQTTSIRKWFTLACNRNMWHCQSDHSQAQKQCEGKQGMINWGKSSAKTFIVASCIHLSPQWILPPSRRSVGCTCTKSRSPQRKTAVPMKTYYYNQQRLGFFWRLLAQNYSFLNINHFKMPRTLHFFCYDINCSNEAEQNLG